MDVPSGHWQGSCLSTFIPSISITVPNCSVCCRVFSSTCAMAAMEASASPLKPMVRMLNKSSAARILEVACFSKHMRASVSLIPQPLSITCIRALPACFTISLTCVAPLSMAFSSSSLTALAGRCITSPAAIWLAILSGKRRMISMRGKLTLLGGKNGICLRIFLRQRLNFRRCKRRRITRTAVAE